MTPTRRSFLKAAASLGVGAATAGLASPLVGSAPAGRSASPSSRHVAPPPGYDPWIEVNSDHLRTNAREVARATAGRPIMAVVKNNGYGLGLEEVGPTLDAAPGVVGLAVVKVEEALRLRAAGVRKPVLLMSRATLDEARELVRRNIRLAPFSDGDGERLERLGRELQRPIPVHLYLDTGMSRLGMPHHRALPWLQGMARRPEIRVEGSFMGFTEDTEYDREQLRRFLDLAREAREQGIPWDVSTAPPRGTSPSCPNRTSRWFGPDSCSSGRRWPGEGRPARWS